MARQRTGEPVRGALSQHPFVISLPAPRASARTSAAFTALKDVDLDIAQGRVRLLPRALGLRQDDAAAHHRRARGADAPAASSRPGATSRALPPAERDYGIVFQSYALFPNLTWPTTWPTAWSTARCRGPRSRRASASCWSWSACPAARPSSRRQLSGGQQQRIALARALATVAGAAAARRAAVGARRDRARAPAPGDPQPAAQARRDHDHGHARPGRGAVGGRPHRRDEPRRDRAGRHADAGLPRPGDRPSSPTSSAASTCCRRRSRRPAGCASARAASTARTTARPARACQGLPAARRRAGAADRAGRRQRLRGRDRQDRVPRLVLPGARAQPTTSASTGSPSTCRSTSWPSSGSRSAAGCRCALLPERMRVF